MPPPAPAAPLPPTARPARPSWPSCAGRCREAAGRPLVVQRHTDGAVARLRRPGPTWPSLADRGPLTPDHVIRTKRVPMVGRDVAAYVAAYEAYVERRPPPGPRPSSRRSTRRPAS